QPHTTLDFSKDSSDLLFVLGKLRKNLQSQRDEHGYALKFPRFKILYNLLENTEGQKVMGKDEFEELMGDLISFISLVSSLNLILGLLMFILMFVLKLIARISFIRTFVRKLVDWGYERVKGRPELRWYQDQVKFKELNLPQGAPISDILRRLREMCLSDG